VSELLNFAVRTPHAAVFEDGVEAARVPTETGQVGLRPRGEPAVLAVEPGLVVLRLDAATVRFAATAGGLLESGRTRCVLYTPFAVVGESEDELLAALAHILSTPGNELAARRQLGELEQRIVRELSHGEPSTASLRGARV
jgi:F0F1-type ATP synthase epsilon subunit